MKVALVLLVSTAVLKGIADSADPTVQLTGLGSFVYEDRSNIFVGKIMPSQYATTTKPALKPCQCRLLCLEVNCASATWFGIPDNSDSICLISHDYFSHLDLKDPSADDYWIYFQLKDQAPRAPYSITLYWFRDDYELDGKFYKVHRIGSPFRASTKTCLSEGGHLATLETDDEIQRVLKKLNLIDGDKYWIGLYRFNSTDPPRWQYVNRALEASMEHIQITGISRCFSLQYYSLQGWYMTDSNCREMYHFVCERNF